MKDFGFGTQIRKSPFFDATVKWGAKDFSVYNHMYIPRDFGNPEQNFWNLINDAILCDVAVERQVQVKGPDASKFVQMMTPRDLSTMQVGQCKYVILINQNGGPASLTADKSMSPQLFTFIILSDNIYCSFSLFVFTINAINFNDIHVNARRYFFVFVFTVPFLV